MEHTNKKTVFFQGFTKSIFILFLIYSSVAFSQKESANWYFGANAGLTFNSGSPVPLLDSAMNAPEGTATISDKNGNLLFYTNGVQVYTRNHTQMPNGNGLLGTGTPSQATLIVPKPGDTNIYYIFTVSGQESRGREGLNYYEVNMALNGGLGDVTLMNGKALNASPVTPPLTTPVSEKLTAVSHFDGKQIWVLCHSASNNNNFLAFRVSETGVSQTPVVSSVGYTISYNVDNNNFGLDHNGVGYLKLSPDGKKLASATILSYANSAPSLLKSGLELFDFNSATGVVSNPKVLNQLNNYSTEFSPNSKVLYSTSSVGSNADRVYQYDLATNDETAIKNSQLLIGSQTGTSALQLAIDGKIYVANNGFPGGLHVINSPNTLGAMSDFRARAASIGGKTSFLGLPQFIASLFQEKIAYEGVCFNSPTTLSIVPYTNVQSATWNFADPDSGTANTSTDINPVHTFTKAGTYNVSVTFVTATGTNIQITSEVIINALPVANKPQDLTICTLQTAINFDLSTQTSTILGAQPSTDFTVTYHATQTDANNATNAISTPGAYLSSGQIIYARVTNNQSGCFSTVTFNLIVSSFPSVTQIGPISVCDTDVADGLTSIDLKEQESALLNGQTGITVTYYTSEADSKAGTNAVPDATAFKNTVNPQVVYVALSNAAGCDSYSSFQINVLDIPLTPAIPNLSICDTGNMNNTAVFNLTEQEAVLLAGQTGVTVAYYTTEADAKAGLNGISTPAAYTNTSNSQTIYVALTNANGCNSYTNFTLNVLTVPVVPAIPAITACNVNGSATFDLTDKEAALINGQAGVTVTYYTDATTTNAITTPASFTSTTSPQTIYVVLNNGNCSAVGSFNLETLETPQLADNLSIEGCSPFDLTSVIAEIGTGFTIDYYTSEADALADSNAISSPATYILTGNQGTVYIRAENASGCYNVAPLALVTGNCEIQRGISPGDGDKNNTFDLSGYNVTKITIFNRYGKEVYSKNNYKNEWGGQASNGDELPTGTYFYTFNSATTGNKTGWIYINRQN
jgi:gliding motility-associated-like protein